MSRGEGAFISSRLDWIRRVGVAERVNAYGGQIRLVFTQKCKGVEIATSALTKRQDTGISFMVL